jgi:hypothetical protein
MNGRGGNIRDKCGVFAGNCAKIDQIDTDGAEPLCVKDLRKDNTLKSV